MFVISSNGNDNHQWQSLGGGAREEAPRNRISRPFGIK